VLWWLSVEQISEQEQNMRKTHVYLFAALLVLSFVLIAGCSNTENPTAQDITGVVDGNPVGDSELIAALGWSAGGPGTVTLLSDGTTDYPSMSYLLSGMDVWSPQTWQLSTTATEAMTVTLPFHYTGFHAYYQVEVWVEAFVGGTTYPLISQGPTNCCSPPSGGFDLDGSIMLNVSPGDVFGFRFGGMNYDSDARLLGTFTVLWPTFARIDIKPGSDPNSINCRNEEGVITVAILSTDDFDATMVDHTTVTFEGATETHVNMKTGEPRRHQEDVDGDGDMDLVFHFRFGETTLDCYSTQGTLIGKTLSGEDFQGTDSVRMVHPDDQTAARKANVDSGE
jgi:hypothetical protein